MNLAVNAYDHEPEDDPQCQYCGAAMEWEDCWNCEDGYEGHDCGEDCCCCLHPEPNVRCDVCGGEGGYLQCIAIESEKHQKAYDAAQAQRLTPRAKGDSQ